MPPVDTSAVVDAIRASYDEIPYDSAPISETHPANLAMQGRLFGLAPADPGRCRVLELGCAAGGNLIPMAWHLPDSEFVGIELSGAQAAAGQAIIAALGLTNVRIVQADILALADPGRFDYAIAHGVYSWVPAAVRERLLALCGQALTPQGIAYVSYNTLPGWRLRGVLRDMLRERVRAAPTPRARLAQAQEALPALEAAFAAQDGAIAGWLRDEIARLRTRHPSYLYHEYLAEVNAPLLFREFSERAGAHGLQYLCEAELHTMFAESLGEAGAAFVDGFDDLIEQEQQIDFLRVRAYRQTLLCRTDVALTRELDLDRFAMLFYHASLVPKEPPDLRTVSPQPFVSPAGSICVAQHPLTKAALQALAEAYPDSLDFGELFAAARARVRAAGSAHADARPHLLGELVRLYLRQYLGVRPAPVRMARAPAARPCATPLARIQAAAGIGHVSTVHHEPMQLDDFALCVLQRLDGTRTLAQLVEGLLADIRASRLRLDPMPDRTVLADVVTENCARLLGMFARHGVVTPAGEVGA